MTEKDLEMLFYCRDCQKLVFNPTKKGDKYVYVCPFCKGDRVAFGTKSAVCDYFHIKEGALNKMINPDAK
ncbi:hypothetical protein KKC94_04260 [Patescibacteria group bacterium]|nr:hypothetical protein [Patescibacteria group bacterium]